MLDKNMTVEAAVMENPKVLKEIQKLGAEYDFIAMESLEDALKSLGTNYEDFLKKVQDQVEFKDMDRVYKMNKEELINYIVNTKRESDRILLKFVVQLPTCFACRIS